MSQGRHAPTSHCFVEGTNISLLREARHGGIMKHCNLHRSVLSLSLCGVAAEFGTVTWRHKWMESGMIFLCFSIHQTSTLCGYVTSERTDTNIVATVTHADWSVQSNKNKPLRCNTVQALVYSEYLVIQKEIIHNSTSGAAFHLILCLFNTLCDQFPRSESDVAALMLLCQHSAIIKWVFY